LEGGVESGPEGEERGKQDNCERNPKGDKALPQTRRYKTRSTKMSSWTLERRTRDLQRGMLFKGTANRGRLLGGFC